MAQIVEKMFGRRKLRPEDFLFMSLLKSKSSDAMLKSSRSQLYCKMVEGKELSLKQYDGFITKSAVLYTVDDLIRKMEIQNKAFMQEFNIRYFPVNIFAWSPHDFLFRITQENVVYIDIISRALSKQQLEVYKYKTDIHELLKLLKRILEEYELDDLSEHLLLTLNDYNDKADLNKFFQTQFRSTMKLQTRQTLSQRTYRDRETARQVESTIEAFDLTKVSCYYIAPIELRYAGNWYASMTEQARLHNEMALNKLEQENRQLRHKISQDSYAFKCVMNTYYSMIENYKSRYYQIEFQYNDELEYVETQVLTSANQLRKANDELKYLQDQVAMFRLKVAEQLEELRMEESVRARSTIKSATSQGKSRTSVRKRKAGKRR